jgi:hypothetical protein
MDEFEVFPTGFAHFAPRRKTSESEGERRRVRFRLQLFTKLFVGEREHAAIRVLNYVVSSSDEMMSERNASSVTNPPRYR